MEFQRFQGRWLNQAQDQPNQRPNEGFCPHRHVQIALMGKQHGRAHEMADEQDRHIGRSIVCAMMVKFLTAIFAGVHGLEISAKQLAFAAGRAAMAGLLPGTVGPRRSAPSTASSMSRWTRTHRF